MNQTSAVSDKNSFASGASPLNHNTIGVAALSLPASAPGAVEESEIDRPSIEQALERAHGVIAHAARDLGLSRQALYRRMEKLGLKPEAPRPTPAA